MLTASGDRFRRRLGTRFVYPSDEFYIKAREVFPGQAFYEDFPQIENGVGMVADFLASARRVRIPRGSFAASLTLLTGESFSGVLRPVIERLRTGPRSRLPRIIVVKNDFFGRSVTVSGLLSGRDMIAAVRGRRLGTRLLIPANTLKDDGRTFLDDLTIDDLTKAAGVPVVPVTAFADVVAALEQHPGRGTHA